MAARPRVCRRETRNNIITLVIQAKKQWHDPFGPRQLRAPATMMPSADAAAAVATSAADAGERAAVTLNEHTKLELVLNPNADVYVNRIELASPPVEELPINMRLAGNAVDTSNIRYAIRTAPRASRRRRRRGQLAPPSS